MLSISKDIEDYHIFKQIIFWPPDDMSAEEKNKFDKEYVDFEKRIHNCMDEELLGIYEKPEHLALVLILMTLRYSNSYLIYTYEVDKEIVIEYEYMSYPVYNDFNIVTVLKPEKFKLKPGVINAKKYLESIYDALISNELQSINKGTTSKEVFVNIFTSSNIAVTKGAIYFNVDRYQMLFILLNMIAKKFDSKFQSTLLNSNKFYKRPVANEVCKVITQRDINDFNKYQKSNRVKNQFNIETLLSKIG